MLVRCSPRGMEAGFVAHCLGTESHPAIAESHLHDRSPAQTAHRRSARQVVGIRRRHRLTALSMAAALVARLDDLLIVEKASPMVPFAVAVAAAVAVAGLAVETPVTVVIVGELAVE